MRKIIMFNRVTLDGFFAGPQGEIDWFVHDPAVDKTLHEKMSPDTVLFGSTTFDMFESHWPHVGDNPNAHPGERQVANELTQMTKLVFSKTRKESDWENTRFYNGQLQEEVVRLKEGDGADIVIFGSGTIVQQLTEAGLIDEYFFVVTPVALGKGKTLFAGLPPTHMQLVETKPFESGNVLLRYNKA